MPLVTFLFCEWGRVEPRDYQIVGGGGSNRVDGGNGWWR